MTDADRPDLALLGQHAAACAGLHNPVCLTPAAVLWLVAAARQVDQAAALAAIQSAAAEKAEADRDRQAAELAELREAAAKVVGPRDVCSAAVRVDQLRALARLLPATPEVTP
jgi:adenosylcobinamide amidohydrolase